MNRELQQVRRYWPRAVTMVSGEWYTAAGLKADLYHIGQVWQVTITTPGDAYRRHCQPTIAQAMRAAGFGGRPLGTMGRDPARVLVDRQRPRKGARLGRRKRTGRDKEETRHFAQWRELEGRP